jgi:hypothetical protein
LVGSTSWKQVMSTDLMRTVAGNVRFGSHGPSRIAVGSLGMPLEGVPRATFVALALVRIWTSGYAFERQLTADMARSAACSPLLKLSSVHK